MFVISIKFQQLSSFLIALERVHNKMCKMQMDTYNLSKKKSKHFYILKVIQNIRYSFKKIHLNNQKHFTKNDGKQHEDMNEALIAGENCLKQLLITVKIKTIAISKDDFTKFENNWKK
ncbi:hypothetical protein RFI_00686 [Reticulomyxa filosa]|uniref:Uncharacterized protein n=1 Tax=Reticulomyxa filosa TaxID=46433 RepID=X6PD37_RETFI|nr:hypothetical protein RFI_00686 [Reticulomyxa filosa]|eukprot:ETO36375.1 hypothetical protein RFI_00686 [Reticulomyxa filosa]